MARYSGKVGYAKMAETEPGIWTQVFEERHMKGDIEHVVARTNEPTQINENITLNLRFNLVADEFAFKNFMNIQWLEYAGAKWSVNSAEVFRRRIILNVGELYNERS